MPQQKQICFDEQLLQQFVDERVDESLESEILDHIGSCESCQVRMEGLAANQNVWADIKDNLDEHRFKAVGCETTDLVEADRNRDLNFMQNILAPTDDPSKIGRLGSYEICGIIGRGSAGIVVKALDTRLNRFVAIKILAPVYSSNGSARRRFEREGRSIASVKDDHVIPVYTVDEFQGNPYIVMQYVPGGSLLQRIEKKGALETDEVVCVAMQIAKGLSAAHDRGIVHRDVKPANVLLESGVDRAMVTDFGLARVVDEATMTRSGAISGTPQFMSPEQAMGESLDQRSDLFSLGSVMYAACTGRSPFRSETVFGVIKRVCDSEPRPIREINPKIDEWLVQFIEKLHAKNPDDRFDSSAQVAQLLSQELAYMRSPTLVQSPQRTWAPTKPKLKYGFSGWGYLTAAVAITALLIGSWQAGLGSYVAHGSNWFGVSSLFQEQEQELPRFKNTIETTIDVEDDGNLFLRTNLGTLSVKTHDKPIVEMRLTYTVAAEDQESAAKVFRLLEMNYDADNDEVAEFDLKKKQDAVIIAKFPEQRTTFTAEEIKDSDDLETLKEKLLLDNESYRSAKFELLVPETFNLNLKTEAGPILLTSVDGTVTLHTDGGHVEATNISGKTKIYSAGGHVEVGNVDSNLEIVTNGGHIAVGNVDGDLLAHTAGGHIQVGQVEGESDIKTSGGAIRLERTRGRVAAITAGGQVVVRRAEEAVNIDSASGEIQVYFVGQPSEESVLNSGQGQIKIGLTRDLGFKIDSSTGNGRVVGPFVHGKTRFFHESVNDGEQKLIAKTSNGNVEFFYLEDSVDGARFHQIPEEMADRSPFDIAFNLHNEGRLEESIKAYEEAIELGVKPGVSTFNLGCVWAEKGNPEKAFASLNKAIELGFRDLDQYEFDEDLESLHNDERFVELLGRIKEIDEAGKLLNKAMRQTGNKEYKEAAELLGALMEVIPENETAVFYYGFTLHMSGDVDAAMPYHHQAAATQRYAGLGNYNLACAYSLKGESELALEHLETALDSGFRDFDHIKDDPDLDNIRYEDRYKELMDEGASDDECECEECECEECDECECDECEAAREKAESIAEEADESDKDADEIESSSDKQRMRSIT